MLDYPTLKTLHLTAVSVTLTLFLLRWWWALSFSARLYQRWVRVVPHVNDSLLFLTGLGLANTLGQYPLVTPWLTAKFGALVCYILLGSVAIKRGRTRRQRAVAGVLALLVLAYLIGVAFAHDPQPLR